MRKILKDSGPESDRTSCVWTSNIAGGGRMGPHPVAYLVQDSGPGLWSRTLVQDSWSRIVVQDSGPGLLVQDSGPGLWSRTLDQDSGPGLLVQDSGPGGGFCLVGCLSA